MNDRAQAYQEELPQPPEKIGICDNNVSPQGSFEVGTIKAKCAISAVSRTLLFCPLRFSFTYESPIV